MSQAPTACHPFDRTLHTITSGKPGGAPVAKHTYTYDPVGNIGSWKREAQLANPTGGSIQYQSTVYYDRSDQFSSLVNTPISGATVSNTGHHYLYDFAVAG